MLEKPIEDYDLFENISVDEVVQQMESAWGFTAGKLAFGVKILEEMITDESCVKFLSFPASLVACGIRGLLKEMVKRGLADVVVTTCGTLDHDVARSWKDYFRGSFMMDDDALHERGVNRLGNILVPNESYGLIIEEKMKTLLSSLWDEGVREVSTCQLCWQMGERICREDSILYWAAKNRIPVYVPGITDGAVGYQLWMFSQDHDFRIDLLADEKEINDLMFTAEKTGAVIIGGGISKHHTIWWNQFKDGLDYTVYITTAVEWDGSLSGARPREAVSWGKIKGKSKYVTIEGDASVILPIMLSSLITRMAKE
jgi:deoxyhypusine synthase